MPRLSNTVFAALALNVAAFLPAVGAEAFIPDSARQGLVVPAVISVAYGDPQVASGASATARQGGFGVAGATRWLAAPERTATVESFTAPGVISVGYRNPRVTTSASGVVGQGGYRVAGAVRWLDAAPASEEAVRGTVRLGAL